MERVLKDVVAQCGNGNRPECPVIETLFRERTIPIGTRNDRVIYLRN